MPRNTLGVSVIEVYKSGTKIILSPEDVKVPGIIAAVILKNDNVYYEVVWWSGDGRCMSVVSDYEFQVIDNEQETKRSIGFKNYEKN